MNKLRASAAEKAIFNETQEALSTIDEQFRIDSKLSLAQRDLYDDLIAKREQAVAQAEARDKELTDQRKKLAARAIEVYAKYPEISDDHALVFSFASQLTYGRSMEERELASLTQGLMALDKAVADHAPILRTINDQFNSLIVPEAGASGLVPEVRRGYNHGHYDEEYVELLLPEEQSIYFSNGAQFPVIRNHTRHDVFEEFISLDEDKKGSHQHRTPAKIASPYDVKYGLGKQLNKAEGPKQVSYIIGEELIQEAITNSGSKQRLYSDQNTEFCYQAWLAGRLAGYDFKGNSKDISGQIINSASEIIYNCTRNYRRDGTELIESDTARILLEAVRQLGAEDRLFERFSTQLAEMYDSHTVYRDREVARTLFDAIIKMSNKSSD